MLTGYIRPLHLLLAVSFISTSCSSDDTESNDAGDNDAGDDDAGDDDADDNNQMTFLVHLPANTPDSDKITFWGQGNWTIDMEKLPDDTARAVVSKSDFNPDGTLAYRYTRNGSNFVGAEYLEPDTNEYFFSELGRHAAFVGGTVQEDTVARWRWFPQGDATPPDVAIDPTVPFVDRVSGKPFQPGIFMMDLYETWFDDLFEPTAQYASTVGYNMAAVAPPWQVLSMDTPTLGSDPSAPNYPDSALTSQISAFVEAGIEVLVQPQINPMPELPAGEPTAWWDAWFQQLTEFLVHHAQIAQAAGATRFAFYPYGQHATDPPADVDERFRAVIAKVRDAFTGSVGVTFDEFSLPDGGDILIPDTQSLSWADAVDFFVLQPAGNMVNTATATTQDLVEGARRILAPVRDLAEEYNEPLIIIPVYASVAQSWRGTSFYPVTLANAPYDGEDEWNPDGLYSFDEKDQALVLDAWYRVAAETAVVQSVMPFGYWTMDMPLDPGFSIRGKSAEKVIETWM